MTRAAQSLSGDYFERMFQGDQDPWGLESRPYETAKFEDTILALDGRHHANGFEIGCAGGTLTRRLATSCDRLLAVDVSATALSRARARCVDLSNVTFEPMRFPAECPAGVFDLIVVSEVAYYWDAGDLARAATWLGHALTPGGDLLLVHWTGETDYPHSGDAAVQALRDHLGETVQVVTARRRPHYRLDLWRRV